MNGRRRITSHCHYYTLRCEFVHDETMASASNAMRRVIQLRHEAQRETILIFDTAIDDNFPQTVKEMACDADVRY